MYLMGTNRKDTSGLTAADCVSYPWFIAATRDPPNPPAALRSGEAHRKSQHVPGAAGSPPLDIYLADSIDCHLTFRGQD